VGAEISKQPLRTPRERKNYHLKRFGEHIYDGHGRNPQFHIGTVENAPSKKDGKVLYWHAMGPFHFHKFSQNQIAAYLSRYVTHNDFDLPHFQKLQLDNFAFERCSWDLLHFVSYADKYNFN
jgi:hypothetical protein